MQPLTTPTPYWLWKMYPKDRKMPSLGSWPMSIIAFQDLRFTSVATWYVSCPKGSLYSARVWLRETTQKARNLSRGQPEMLDRLCYGSGSMSTLAAKCFSFRTVCAQWAHSYIDPDSSPLNHTFVSSLVNLGLELASQGLSGYFLFAAK